jgi:hypothetical protein
VTISQLWPTLAGTISSGLSAKGHHSIRTDLRLIINNISQYRRMKGYYLMGCYHLQAGIDPRQHGSSSVGAPEWPLMSLVNKLIYQ